MWQAKDITFDEFGCATYKAYYNNKFMYNIKLSVVGIHNVYNSLSVCALANFYNLDKDSIDLIENKGYPISSLIEDISFKEKEIQINADDKILFYTDGVTEAMDYSGREYGMKKLIEVIKNSPKDVLNSIERSVFKHSWGEIADDFALLLLEILD